jgi:hypothetical protein
MKVLEPPETGASFLPTVTINQKTFAPTWIDVTDPSRSNGIVDGSV